MWSDLGSPLTPLQCNLVKRKTPMVMEGLAKLQQNASSVTLERHLEKEMSLDPTW